MHVSSTQVSTVHRAQMLAWYLDVSDLRVKTNVLVTMHSVIQWSCTLKSKVNTLLQGRMQDIVKGGSFYCVREIREKFFADHAQFLLATPLFDRTCR